MQVKSIIKCTKGAIAQRRSKVVHIECSNGAIAQCRSKVLHKTTKEHSAILPTCIKLHVPPVFKSLVLSFDL